MFLGPNRSEPRPTLMRLPHQLHVPILLVYLADRWSAQKKGVVRVAGRVLLRLKKRVEVPERAFNELRSVHFFEAHFQQRVSELRAHFEQRMQAPALRQYAFGGEVVFFERELLPLTAFDHIRG